MLQCLFLISKLNRNLISIKALIKRMTWKYLGKGSVGLHKPEESTKVVLPGAAEPENAKLQILISSWLGFPDESLGKLFRV